MRLIATVLLAIAVATLHAATDSHPRVVRIDVIATDARGLVAEDLKPAEFELREDGAPQRLDGVQFVRVTRSPAGSDVAPIRNAEDERQAAAPDDSRLFAIFLDEYHVSAGPNSERARAALVSFMDREVAPRDLVVVMKPLDSVLAIRMTGDRAGARRAIQTFEGRKGDYAPQNAYERNFIAGTPARIESARTQVALSAINALALHLGSLAERRKTVLVVSEGIDRSERRRGFEYLPTIETIVRSANRANVSVYPVDPSETSQADAPAAALRGLATQTDGQSIVIDLETGLRAAAADASAYYLLTFQSSRPDDGKFHEVQVSVKRSGVRLRSRNGYVAASPDDALRAELLDRINHPKPPGPVEPAPHVSNLVRPWFGVSRGPSGKTRVTFVWEPAGRVPGDRVRRTPARLVLTAQSPDGTVLFEGPVTPTGPSTIDEPGVTPARAVFDAAPGRLRLRMSILDAASQVLDLDVRDLSIRDLRGAVAVGTPEVLRARSAHEFRVIDVDAAVPVSTREFSRAERLLIRFPAYGSNGASLKLSATLQSRGGQTMRTLPVAVATTPGGENEIDLPLAGLAAGDYIVEISAASDAGNAKDRITFRVTS